MRLAVLSAIIAFALINRMYFLFYRGGFALDQQAWAVENYLGGLTTVYLNMTNTILAWTAEKQLWSYLPGYPGFLAILHMFGVEDLSCIRLVQIAIDSLVIFPLYYVLLHVCRSAFYSIIGCFIYAVAPWWSVGSTYLLAESLLPALVILLLAAMVAMRDHSSSGMGWFSLGLFAAILPFFRSEMILLAGPLMVWAILVSPKRLQSAVFVASGFMLPLVMWAFRNYYIHGQLMLAPPAKWYAAWSGLGQIANEFGYQANDLRASELLKSMGIGYHSAAAEQYWFSQYLNAWMTHPGYVIRTILRRFEMILGGQDMVGTLTPSKIMLCYGAMAFVTPVVVIQLIRERRGADAFLIAWPMLYALGSLGILYLERRYVRYAGLTYLLALPVALKMIADVSLSQWPHRWRLIELRVLKLTAGTLALAVLIVGAGIQISSIRAAAAVQLNVDRLDVTVPLSPTSTLGRIEFTPAIPTVKLSQNSTGLRLRATAPAGTYLLTAPTGSGVKAVAIVRYRITLNKQGAIGLGILSADSSMWLSHREELGSPGEAVEGTFVSPVDVGSHLVIDAQDVSGETDVDLERLEWAFACSKSADLFRMFFTKHKIQPEACTGHAS